MALSHFLEIAIQFKSKLMILGMKTIIPIVAANSEANNTAPAARSLILPIFGSVSALTKLQSSSIEVFKISRHNTNAEMKSKRRNSKVLILSTQDIPNISRKQRN